MIQAAAGAYTAGLLGSYLSRRAGVYATRALAVGAATAGYKFGNWMKARRNRRTNPVRSGRVQKKTGRNVGRRRRSRTAFSVGNNASVGRKRTAVSAFSSRSKGYVGVKKARRTYRMASTAEFGPQIVTRCTVGRGRMIPRNILNLAMIRRVLRWQGVKSMTTAANDLPGYYVLPHRTTGGTQTMVPIMAFCLNATENVLGTPSFAMQTLNINDNGSLDFDNGSNFVNGVSSQGFVVESTSMNSNFVGNRRIMNAWYDIRMNCYGATSQPTMYDIMVVSFLNNHVDPFETPSNAQEADDRKAMWQGLVQPMMSNPIVPRLAARRNYIVHKRIRFNLDPTTNIENDADPRSRIVRLFIKDGNCYDYCYHADALTSTGADDQLSTANFQAQGTATGDYSNLTLPRARKWLIVRALNTTRTADQASETRANTPSFDFLVRKGEYAVSD